MKKFLVIALLSLTFMGFSQGGSGNFSPSQINAANLKPLLESADYSCTIDKDGDLKCKSGNVLFYVSFDPERKLVKLIRLWGKPDGLSVNILKRKVNEWNDKKIFVRFSVDDKGSTCADYALVYVGGLNRQNFLKSVDLFIKVSQAWAQDVASLLDD